MSPLFRRLILRPLRRDPARTLLTLISIALGVAVVIAIDLAGDAATGSFQSSLTTLLGKVDYEIVANGGVDETLFAKLAKLPVNARFTPVIEQPVAIGGSASTTLYGIDVLSNVELIPGDGTVFDPESLEHAIVVSSDLAERLRLHKNDTVELRGQGNRMEFQIRLIAPKQHSEWVGVDIAAAQQLLNMYGRVDRVEVFLGPTQDSAEAEHAIRAVVPATYEIDTPGAKSEENRRMLRAFRWNLRILSYISLIVGAFLIYNTIAVSVVRRRTEIGILRAIGISSRGVLLIFLGEATMLGLLGSILGIGIGRLLAGGLLKLIAGTVNALFVTSTPGDVVLTPLSISIALVSGTGIAFFSALLPAMEAAGVAPAEAMSRAAREHDARLRVGRNAVIAIVAAVLAALCCLFGPIAGRPVMGYAATLLAIGAAAAISPGFVTSALRFLKRPLKRFAGAEGLIASRSLTASLARTSVVVTALGTAIAMMVSVGIMVGSFRETVQMWLGSQLQADLYLRATGPAAAGIFPPLADAVPEIIRAAPGVADVDIFHAFEFRYEGSRATFGAGSAQIQRAKNTLRFLAGGYVDGNSDAAIVSEPFANKHHVRVGDVLKIPLGATLVSLKVRGIYFEYSSDRGYVIADRKTLLKYLPKQPITNIAVWLQPGADADKIRRDLETRLEKYPLGIAPNTWLREQAVIIFDRTFAVTYALEAVAIIVAMLGAANALLALVLDRRREIGLIRYLGATARQVRRMILTEAGLIGLLAGLLGLALGSALSLVLIFVINKQSFGWTIQFHPPGLLLGAALLAVWIVTILAGLYPARVATGLKPVEVVHEE